MSFTAKYVGVCGVCEEAIKPGEEVQYVNDELTHTVCPLEKPLREMCSECFTEKSVSGSCLC